ncbi:MAG: hypothetical protein Q4G06_01980 [Clostridia bacterium]|nr:hypothetical protein [Clostridia bacterium]
MKQLFETIKAARWLELTIAVGLICILIVLALGSGGGSAASEEEARMQRILSKIGGAGQVSVMIARDERGDCTGVVVVASGAEDVEVMLRLQRAVQALTDLELSQIEIVR